jgi:hypothetical protein
MASENRLGTGRDGAGRGGGGVTFWLSRSSLSDIKFITKDYLFYQLELCSLYFEFIEGIVCHESTLNYYVYTNSEGL